MRPAQSLLYTLLISNVLAQGLLGDVGDVLGGGGGSGASAAAASPSRGRVGTGGRSRAPNAEPSDNSDPGLLGDPLEPVNPIVNGADTIVQPPATPPARAGRQRPSANEKGGVLPGDLPTDLPVPVVSPVVSGVNSQLNGGGNGRNRNGGGGLLDVTTALSPVASPLTDTLGKATRVVEGAVSQVTHAAGHAVSDVTKEAANVVSTLHHAAGSIVRTGAPDLIKTILPDSKGGGQLLDPVLGNGRKGDGLLPTVGSVLHSVVSDVDRPLHLPTNIVRPLTSVLRTISKIVETELPKAVRPIEGDPKHPGVLPPVLEPISPILGTKTGLIPVITDALPRPIASVIHDPPILHNPPEILTNPGGIISDPLGPATSIVEPILPHHSSPPQDTRPDRPSRPQPSPIVPEVPPQNNRPSHQPHLPQTPEVPPAYPPTYHSQAPPHAVHSYQPDEQPPAYRPSASPPESGPSHVPEHPIQVPYPSAIPSQYPTATIHGEPYTASFSDAAHPQVAWTSSVTFHFQASAEVSASKSAAKEAKASDFTTKHQTYTLNAQTLAANAGSSMLVLPTGALPDSDAQIGSASPGKVLSQCMLGLAGIVLGGMVLL